jgi:uncharacterized protein with PCYCGC motif
MGRKSTAKAKGAQASPPSDNPPPGRRGFTPLLAVAIALAVIAGAWFTLGGRSEPQAQTPPAAAASPAPAEQTPVEAVNARFGPHTQATLPPLDWGPMPPARPPDVTRAVYTFAAEHPEILGYVPCYCGCERGGHRGNDDCFVAARAANGDVTTWEPHGAT